MPLISILTVTRNAVRHLPNLITDYRNAKRQDCEWIVVDGASTDGTGRILESSWDIIQSISEPDAGIYDAMNKAIQLAKGEYIVFFGADDRLFPDALEKIRSFILKHDAKPDVIVARVKIGNKIRMGYKPNLHWLGPNSCVTGHSVGMLVRRSVILREGGFSLRYPQCADGLLIKRLMAGNYSFVQSEVLMGIYGSRGVSSTNVGRGLCEGYLIQLETERSPILQFILFLLRLLKNLPKLVAKRGAD